MLKREEAHGLISRCLLRRRSRLSPDSSTPTPNELRYWTSNGLIYSSRLANLEGLASQVAGQSIGPELVRVAAELGEVRERLPALQGIDPALAGLVKLSEELGKVVPSVELVERFGALLRAMITEMRPYQVEIQAAAEKLPQINSPQTWETFKRLEAVARFLERVAAQWGYTDIEPGSGR